MTAKLLDGSATLDELVAELALPVSGAALAAALHEVGAAAGIVPARAGLSAEQGAYLDAHSGIRPDDSALERTLSRTLAQALAVRVGALTTAELATRLGKDASRVRHLAREGALVVLPGGGRSTLFPAWQLEGAALVPGLRIVLAGLPEELGAVSVARFMTQPSPELTIDGAELSPRDWLLAGGDPTAVVELAAGLDGPP